LQQKLIWLLSYKEVLAMLEESDPPIPKEMLNTIKQLHEDQKQPKPEDNEVKGGGEGSSGGDSGGSSNNKTFVFLGKVLLTIVLLGVIGGISLWLYDMGLKIPNWLIPVLALGVFAPIWKAIWD
jgi:hypothetical protein